LLILSFAVSALWIRRHLQPHDPMDFSLIVSDILHACSGLMIASILDVLYLLNVGICICMRCLCVCTVQKLKLYFVLVVECCNLSRSYFLLSS